MPIKERSGNLAEFPKTQQHDDATTHVSIGDIHGNALKLIYTLIEEGVIGLNEEQYNQLRDIYLTATDELTPEKISTFKNIISKATVQTTRAITLIGDELADRGNNDYFTLLVLQKLKQSDCNIDIMISNHSMDFMQASTKENFTGKTDINSEQTKSLQNMQKLLSKGYIKESDVREIVENDYAPMVKAIGYTVSPDGQITLFSHAPIGLETIEALAEKFGVEYKDKTPLDLIHTVDAINAKVKEQFGPQLCQAFKQENVTPENPGSLNTPLNRLIWNRLPGSELKTKTSSGIEVRFVHGHIGQRPSEKLDGSSLAKSHENLDNNFGKATIYFKTNNTIQHFTRHSSDLPAKKLEEGMLKSPSLNGIMTDAAQAVNKQRIQEKFKKELTSLYDNYIRELENISRKLTKKARQDSSYQQVSHTLNTNIATLRQSGRNFFSSQITEKSLGDFKTQVQTCHTNIKTASEKHRGWHSSENKALRFTVGAILSVISVGLLPLFGKFRDCFFNTPATKTATAVTQLDSQHISQMMKSQLTEIKSAASQPTNEENKTLQQTPRVT